MANENELGSVPDLGTADEGTADLGSQTDGIAARGDDTELRNMFRQLTSKEESEPETPADKAPASLGQQPARGPDGKFAKAAENSAPADAALAPEQAVADGAETPEQKAAREAIEAAEAAKPAVKPGTEKAPSSWKANTQAKWDTLDPEVKEEIHRREANFHEGLQNYKQLADIGKQFDTEFRPYEAMIRAGGVTPQQLVRNWMNTEYQLKTGSPDQKAALFVEYAGLYGLTPQMISDAYQKVAEGKPPVDPTVVSLQNEVKTLKEQREEEARVAGERERAEIQNEIDAFKNAAGHEDYELVKLHMAALMRDGRAPDLQTAYDQACWAVPEVRTRLQAKQQEADKTKAAERAAVAKKAAQTNVTPRGTLPRKPVVGTMEDTLRARYKELTTQT